MSFQRLRTDFRFAIVILFGTIAALCIAPFAVYRFATGQTMAGLLDLAILVCISAGITYAWRGGDLERVGLAVVATTTVGYLGIVVVTGPVGVPWGYVVLLSHFLLVGRRKAIVAAAVAIGFVAMHPGAFGDSLQRVVFVVTALVVGLFAFVFAHRTDTQRERLEALASQDPLTGAFNRRAMVLELQLAAEASRRNHTSVGLAVLDLDHFKRVNDRFGHEAGDRVLLAFARLVMQATRKGDRFFRHGGEEFALLLPGADAGATQALTEMLRSAVSAQLSCHGEAVTVSIGAAMLRPGEDVVAWLARADAAMYRAKHQGRDRVVVDEDPRAPAVASAKSGTAHA